MLSAKVFWSRTGPGPNGCVEWAGATDTSGYGKVGRKQEPAHRVAYRMVNGDPGALCVCHSCDNPRCVNPEHLWLGTHAENMRDMVLKGRHFRASQTHCRNGHEFTEQNTYPRPEGGRACRLCGRDRSARYKAKRK